MGRKKPAPERHRKAVTKGISRYDFEGSLEHAIARLQEERALIPEQYRASATYEIEDELRYGGTSIEVVIKYYRPETDEEMTTRLERDDSLAMQAEKREREQYQRLKEKFEGK